MAESVRTLELGHAKLSLAAGDRKSESYDRNAVVMKSPKPSQAVTGSQVTGGSLKSTIQKGGDSTDDSAEVAAEGMDQLSLGNNSYKSRKSVASDEEERKA